MTACQRHGCKVTTDVRYCNSGEGSLYLCRKHRDKWDKEHPDDTILVFPEQPCFFRRYITKNGSKMLLTWEGKKTRVEPDAKEKGLVESGFCKLAEEGFTR